MTSNKSYGYWSILFSVAGSLLLVASYLISPNEPQGMIVIGLQIMLLSAIVLLGLGVVTSTLAIRKKEEGIKKYIGILLPVIIILFAVLVPILMGIGFMLNDNP